MITIFIEFSGASSYECVFDEKSNQTFPRFFKPRFTSASFYLIMFFWALLACFSFYLLNWHKNRIEKWFPTRHSTVQAVDSENQNKSKMPSNRQRDWLILLCLAILGMHLLNWP